MRLLVILDPLTSLNPKKDTSLAIMREAASRGHALFVAEQGDLVLRGNQVSAYCKTFAFQSATYLTGEPTSTSLQDFDAVLMRKDPPFDMEYIYSTYLLELAEQQGAKVFNRPSSIRDFNEKLSIAQFAEFAPPFVVTRHMSLMREFLADHGDIVVKPLDGMGGSGVFRLKHDDPNIGVILETITQLEQRTVMAQRYLPEIKDGDKRILMINGEAVPYALARIPKAGETRGNLAAGGTGRAQLLSQRDREIAQALGSTLRERGLFLVGLDVIGDYLTEINVTSPTCMVEIAVQSECKPAVLFVDALEKSA
ncbi:MAG: glutathione synthase [Methylophilales bacterium]|nr:glutathione synthase [Methylophilales bacterium]